MANIGGGRGGGGFEYLTAVVVGRHESVQKYCSRQTSDGRGGVSMCVVHSWRCRSSQSQGAKYEHQVLLAENIREERGGGDVDPECVVIGGHEHYEQTLLVEIIREGGRGRGIQYHR